MNPTGVPMTGETPPSTPADDHDDYDYQDDECANCGGEGFVSHCFEEWACMYPDEGCDLCMRRCDWCNNPTPTRQA